MILKYSSYYSEFFFFILKTYFNIFFSTASRLITKMVGVLRMKMLVVLMMKFFLGVLIL